VLIADLHCWRESCRLSLLLLLKDPVEAEFAQHRMHDTIGQQSHAPIASTSSRLTEAPFSRNVYCPPILLIRAAPLALERRARAGARERDEANAGVQYGRGLDSSYRWQHDGTLR